VTHEFEISDEIDLPATPEQVWAAIATGPGIDSWFMGHSEIEPREGGKRSWAMPGFTQASTITTWEPGRRFAFTEDPEPDGTFMAFEYLLEAGAGDTTVLRYVHSGFMTDDWEEQYDAVKAGDRMYLYKLASYLRFFPGRTASFSFSAWGPQVTDADRVWEAFTGVTGLTSAAVNDGDRGELALGRSGPASAIVDYIAHRPSILGVRTSDSLYRFIHGYRDVVVVEQHCFDGDEAARKLSEDAWQGWLATKFTRRSEAFTADFT
jgi:uncharacterized protein YndB with AHSA1/START domain